MQKVWIVTNELDVLEVEAQRCPYVECHWTDANGKLYPTYQIFHSPMEAYMVAIEKGSVNLRRLKTEHDAQRLLLRKHIKSLSKLP